MLTPLHGGFADTSPLEVGPQHRPLLRQSPRSVHGSVVVILDLGSKEVPDVPEVLYRVLHHQGVLG